MKTKIAELLAEKIEGFDVEKVNKNGVLDVKWDKFIVR